MLGLSLCACLCGQPPPATANGKAKAKAAHTQDQLFAFSLLPRSPITTQQPALTALPRPLALPDSRITPKREWFVQSASVSSIISCSCRLIGFASQVLVANSLFPSLRVYACVCVVATLSWPLILYSRIGRSLAWGSPHFLSLIKLFHAAYWIASNT